MEGRGEEGREGRDKRGREGERREKGSPTFLFKFTPLAIGIIKERPVMELVADYNVSKLSPQKYIMHALRRRPIERNE